MVDFKIIQVVSNKRQSWQVFKHCTTSLNDEVTHLFSPIGTFGTLRHAINFLDNQQHKFENTISFLFETEEEKRELSISNEDEKVLLVLTYD